MNKLPELLARVEAERAGILNDDCREYRFMERERHMLTTIDALRDLVGRMASHHAKLHDDYNDFCDECEALLDEARAVAGKGGKMKALWTMIMILSLCSVAVLGLVSITDLIAGWSRAAAQQSAPETSLLSNSNETYTTPVIFRITPFTELRFDTAKGPIVINLQDGSVKIPVGLAHVAGEFWASVAREFPQAREKICEAEAAQAGKGTKP